MKGLIYSMRVNQGWLDQVNTIADRVNGSLLGEQMRARGFARFTAYDLVMLAVENTFDVPEPSGRTLLKVGNGFDRAPDAARRITSELARIDRQKRNRNRQIAEHKGALKIIEGGAA